MAVVVPTLLSGASSSIAEEEHKAIFRAAGLPVPTFLHGVREPDATYQRSRADAFNDLKVPFFDWYYIYVRDVEQGHAYAFTYSMSRCGRSDDAANCTFEGAWPGFVTMAPGVASAAYTERHPLSAWRASSDRQHAEITSDRSALSIVASQNGSRIRLRGLLNSTDHIWRAQGALGKEALSWDLTITRRAGWFGESWIEAMHLGRLTGAIMWSPYSHQATVEGTLSIGGKAVTFSGDGNRHRAYADSNWGETMPRPPPGADDPIHFPWGWYYAAQPRADPAADVSIICGAGRSYMRFAGTVYGKLCDMRIGSALRLSLWSWTFERLGNRTASWASDGGAQGVTAFEITRTEWSDWQDEYGRARVPMAQVVRIETRHHEVTLRFSASPNATTRLVFPLQDVLFSDFEALGATAQVTVREKGVATPIAAFTDPMAGLEFGYRVPTKQP